MTKLSDPATVTIRLIIDELDANQVLRLGSEMQAARIFFANHPGPLQIDELDGARLEPFDEAPGTYILSVDCVGREDQAVLPDSVTREKFKVLKVLPPAATRH